MLEISCRLILSKYSCRTDIKKRLIKSTYEFISDNCWIIYYNTYAPIPSSQDKPRDLRYDYTRASVFRLRNGYQLPSMQSMSIAYDIRYTEINWHVKNRNRVKHIISIV